MQDGDAKSLFSTVSHLPGWKVVYQSGSIINCFLEKQTEVGTQSMPLIHTLFPGQCIFPRVPLSAQERILCQSKAITAL